MRERKGRYRYRGTLGECVVFEFVEEIMGSMRCLRVCVVRLVVSCFQSLCVNEEERKKERKIDETICISDF